MRPDVAHWLGVPERGPFGATRFSRNAPVADLQRLVQLVSPLRLVGAAFISKTDRAQLVAEGWPAPARRDLCG